MSLDLSPAELALIISALSTPPQSNADADDLSQRLALATKILDAFKVGICASSSNHFPSVSLRAGNSDSLPMLLNHQVCYIHGYSVPKNMIC